MKILPILLLLTTVQIAHGQSDNQRDLVEILEVAFRADKLPSELLQKPIQNFAPWTKSPFIIVKSDSTKKLDSNYYPVDSSHVWVVDYTHIFESELTCGLVLLDLKRKGKRLTIEYKTVEYPYSSKENTKKNCHSGKLTAERKGDSWTIVSSKTKEISCEVDMFGRKK